MGWEVEIVGDAATIQALADCLLEGAHQVRKLNDRFFLAADQFERLDDARSVRQAAGDILDVLNGAAFLLLSARQRLDIGSVTRRDGDSQSVWVFPEPAVGYANITLGAISVIGADGIETIHRPADPVKAWTQEAARRPSVGKALRLRAEPTLGWVELYRILEVVTTEVAFDRIIVNGWATKAELRRFKQTANSVAASGDGARHGAEREEPPAEPMTLADGRRLIDRILIAWLSH